jgi:DNA-binding transcriptional LysR family regulator
MAWSNPELDIRYLRVFVAIVRAGGFTQAQLELGLSQSTISNQIGSLEESLGFTLCERGRSGFRLTLKGEAVYQSAIDLFGVLDDFHEGLIGLKQIMLGRLRIGLLNSINFDNLTALHRTIAHYTVIAPDVSLEFTRLKQDELENSLMKGGLDVAIGTAPPHEDFHSVPIGAETFCLAASVDHPLQIRSSTLYSDLIKYRFISSNSLSQEEQAKLGTIQPCSTTTELDEKIALLRISKCYGYLPASLLLQPTLAGIKALPTNEWNIEYSLTLFRRRSRGNRIIRAFFDAVHQTQS